MRRQWARAVWTGHTTTAPPPVVITFSLKLPLRSWISRQVRLELTPDDAAVMHAQLDRLLSRGWATSETERLQRQRGEQIYPPV